MMDLKEIFLLLESLPMDPAARQVMITAGRHYLRPVPEHEKMLALLTQATQLGSPGFRGGWVSSVMFQRACFANGMTPSGQQVTSFLLSRGYMLHPRLRGGQVGNKVMPDDKRTRLFVMPGHPSLNPATPIPVEREYRQDQGY